MIHVYTGNGKGKSTAAFGLAVRALGAGKKVFVAQFVKDMKYSECFLEEYFPEDIKIEQWGASCLLDREPTGEDYSRAKEGLERCVGVLQSGIYDVVVMDELNIALYLKLLTIDEVLEALKHRTDKHEVIITGRYAPSELIGIADLVTEMREVKHYYQKGVPNRRGIDL